MLKRPTRAVGAGANASRLMGVWLANGVSRHPRTVQDGAIRWNSRRVNVSHLLAESEVGLEEIDDGLWDVYVGPHKGGPIVLPIS